MNRKFRRFIACFIIGIGLQAGAYAYLDHLFAPLSASDYDMSDVKANKAAADAAKKKFAKVNVKGKAYYSYDYQYMADVTKDAVLIYSADNLDNPQSMDLKNKDVSFFEWMPDRNLALVALYPSNWHGGTWDVTLARYNPEATARKHESDAPIDNLPRGAKIVDVAYSTATNAVYMKVEVGKGLYRIYRTDANYDTRRIYVQTSHIGHIAVFYDEDRLFYDDSERGVMYTFNGSDSSWRVISPPGSYRLVGLGRDKTIYAARVNTKGEVIGYYTGKLGVGFKQVKALDTPVDFNTVTVMMIQEAARQNADDNGNHNKK